MLLLPLVMVVEGMAQSPSIDESFLLLNVKGTGKGYNLKGSFPGYTDEFKSNANLGTFSSGETLVLNGTEIKTTECSTNDVQSSTYHYRVYKTGSASTPAFTSVSITSTTQVAPSACGGNIETWRKDDGNQNILQGLTPGTYTLEVYTSASYTPSGALTDDNAGNYYKVQFTLDCSWAPQAPSVSIPSLAPVCASAGTVSISANASGGGGGFSYAWTVPAGAANPGNVSSFNASTAYPGVYTVVVTDANGCTATDNETLVVNANPIAPAIGGSSSVCVGSDITLTTTASGTIVWNSLNTSVANISSSGVVTGATAGTADITYTVTAANGCSTTSAVKTITVNANPVANAITGLNVVCPGNTIDLNSNATGTGTLNYAWSSSNTGVATVDNSGLVTGVIAGNISTTYTVTDGNGCTATSAPFMVTVNPPAPATPGAITGSGSVCPGQTGRIYSITGVTNATSYNWLVPTGWTITAGHGTTSITATAGTAGQNGDITVTATNSCGTSSAATLAVVVNDNSTLALSSAAGTANQTICNNSTLTSITYQMGGGATGLTLTGSLPTGVTNSFNAGVLTISGTPTQSGTFNYTVTTTGPCNNPSLNGTITVTPNVTPSVTIASNDADNSICAGSSITFTATPTNGGSTPSYQWQRSTNGGTTWLNVGTNAATYTASDFATPNERVRVILTADPSACPLPNTATSNVITLTVNPVLVPTVSISASANPICAGTTVNFVSAVTNEGSAPVYQWKLNGNNVGTNSPSYSNAALLSGDVVTLQITSNALCAAPTSVTSAPVTMTVNPNLPVSVSIGASATTICQGDAVTFTATPTNGGTSPSYQWRVNGSNVGTNSPTFTSTTLNNNDQVTVVLTSNASPCATGSPATSNSVTMTVNPLLPVSVSIAADKTTICQGESVTFTATSINPGTTPTYQWKLNGNNVGGNSPTFTSATLNHGDKVTVVLTSSITPCATGNPAVSNEVTMTVNQLSALNLTSPAASQHQTICVNTAINLVSLAIGGSATSASMTSGSLPAGVTGVFNAGAFTISGTPTASGTFNYTITTSGPCASVSFSGSITVTGNSTIARSSAPGTDAQSICINTPLTNIAYTVGGSATSAAISAGALPAGVNGSYSGGVFTISGTPTASGTFNFTVSTSGPCANASVNGTITVNPNVTPSVSITSNDADNAVCVGNAVTFTATATNGGTPPSYQWRVNGVNQGGPTPIATFTRNNPVNGDVVSVVMTSSAACALPATATSNAITIQVYSGDPANPGAITGPTSICPPANGLVFSINPVSGAQTYNWILPPGFTIVSGAGTTSITVNVDISAEIKNKQDVEVSGVNPCGSSRNSSILQVNVNKFSAVNAGTDIIACSGSTVQLNAILEGAAASMTWTQVPASPSQGSLSSNTAPNAVFTPSITSGTVTLRATPNAPTGLCTSATSDDVTITILPVPTATISAVSPVCAGSTATVTINATANTTVTYRINGGADSTINFGTGETSKTITTAALSANTTYELRRVTHNANTNCFATLTQSATITVNPLATANVGPALTACQSSTPGAITLSGASVGGGASTGAWSIISGGGTLSSTAQLDNTGLASVTYTPAANYAGTVTLRLTTNDPAGPCDAVFAERTITINPSAIATAGGPDVVCQSASPTGIALSGSTVGGSATTGAWSIISGGGALSSTAQTNTPSAIVYTPAANFTGTVTLRLTTNDPAGVCDAVFADRTITVNPLPVVNAGPPITICQEATPSAFTLAGASVTIGGAPAQGAWSIVSGGGSLSSTAATSTPDAITYTPAAGYSGTVVLRLTSEDPAGPCDPVQATRTITINPLPTANAGPAQTICAGTTATLAGSITNAPGATWSSTGTGSFSNARALNAVYTPSAADITAGTVTLTLTTDDPDGPSGPCNTVSANMTLTINPAVVISAGPPQTICSNGTATLAGSISGGASSGTWTTSGSGTFNDNTSPTAVYTPSLADAAAGTVTLTFTSADPAGPCDAVSSQMVLTIIRNPQITTQPSNAGVCATFPASFEVVATGAGLTYQWYKGTAPAGTPVTNGALISGATSSKLNFSQASIADDGTYYVVVSGTSPCTAVTSNPVSLNVDQQIAITAQPQAQTICAQSTLNLTVTANAGTDPLNYQWRRNGTNITGANSATYTVATASAADAGEYDVVITGPAGYTCGTALSQKVQVVVNPLPAATMTINNTTVCKDGTAPVITFTGSNGTAPYTFTYNIDGGPSQTITTTSGNSVTLNVPVSTVGTFAYNLVSVKDASSTACEQAQTGTVSVTVNPLPTATISGTTAVCQNSGSPLVTFIGAGGTAPYTFTYTINGGANQTSTTSSGNSITVAASTGTAGTFTYALVSVKDASGTTCSNGATGSAVITVNPLPTATISGNATVCRGTAPAPNITFTGTGGTAPYTFTYNINGGPTQTVTTTSGNSVTVAAPTGSEGTFVYNLVSVSDASSTACAQPQTGSATVTVLPLPSASISANAATVCQNGTAPVITFTGSGGTPNYTFTYTLNNGTPQTVSTTGGSSTTTINVPVGTAGTYTYKLTGVRDGSAAVCSDIVNGEVTVTVYELPSAIVAGTTTVCINSGSPDVTFTASGGTGPYTFTYNINGAASQTITTTSGNSVSLPVATSSAGTFVYNLLSVADANCSQAQTGSATVTVHPVAQLTLTSAAGTNAQGICFNSTITPITYQASVGVTGVSTTGLPAGVTASFNATTRVFTLIGTPTAAGTYNYELTTQGSSCTNSKVTGTITVEAHPVGGTAANTSGVIFACAGNNGGHIALTGNSAPPTRWESTTNGGLTWTPIASNASTIVYDDLNATTWFRAVVSGTYCSALTAYSDPAAVSVVPHTGPGALSVTTMPSPAIICNGTVTLNAVGIGAGSTVGALTGGEFDDAGINLDGPGLWRKTLINGWDPLDKVNIEASTNNANNTAFNLTNGPKTFFGNNGCSAITYNNNPLDGQPNNTKFMLVSGSNTSSLQTPIFNLVGLSTASMDWWEAYDLKSGASIKIELSLDGGTTYNTTLKTITGPVTYASPTDFDLTRLNLDAYVGLSNLRIRFTYTGTTCSSWGLEKATITKGTVPAIYTWSMYDPIPPTGTPPAHFLNVFQNPSVIAAPPTPNTTNAPIVYNYSLQSSTGGCLDSIIVTVNPTPLATVGPPTTICTGGSINIPMSGSIPNSTLLTWTRDNTTNVTGVPASGSAVYSGTERYITGTLVNNTNVPQTVTFTVTPSYSNGGVSCPGTPVTTTIVVQPPPAIVLSAVYDCMSDRATLTAVVSGSGPFSTVVQPGNITISGTAPTTITVPNITITGPTTFSVNALSVGGCNALASALDTAYVSNLATGPAGLWVGTYDNDWFNKCNWANFQVPDITTDVLIPQNAVRFCEINPNTSPYAAAYNNTAQARNIVITNQELRFGPSGPKLSLLQVARDLTINGSTGLVNMTAGGEIELGGNWTNNRGTDGFQEGAGTVELNGSIQQFIQTVAGQIETFNNLIVNNSLNRTGHDEVVLNSPVNVAGIFTLQDGHVLTTQTNLLTITNPAVGAVVGGSVDSYVNGPMARHTNSTGDYNFPVGKPNGPYTSYRPAIVAPDSNAPTVYNTEYKVQATTPTPLTPRTMLGILNTEYWTINRTGGTSDATVKLGYINPNNNDHWDDVEPCYNCNVAIAKTYPTTPDPTWYFTNYTNNNSGFNTSLPEVRFWADNGLIWTKLLNTFGNFTFGYHYPIVLGVQDQLNLISFNAALQGKDALLSWTIEGLSQAQHFELEYSTNGTTFFKLAGIRPTNVNSYSYLHKELAAGKHHYRLLLIDRQGRKFYSAIRTLTVAKQRTVIKDLPYTVVRNEVMVDIETTMAQSVGFKIIASNGVVLSASEGRLNVGFNRQTIPLPPMSEGIYFIQVTVQDGTTRTLKFMKE